MKKILHVLLIGIILFATWQVFVMLLQIPAYILPSPCNVFLAFFQQRDVILINTLPTLIETLSGFGLGILFGCCAGLIVCYFQPLGRWLLPILIVSQAIPIFAIAPLIVIWLGFGLASKIMITVLMIFFPITSALYDGLHSTPSAWLDLAKTMNGKKWNIFYYIQIPAALPRIASGIRIAAVFAPLGAIVGEWVGSSQGLGYLILNANARMQIDMMFAALIVIIALSLLLYFSIDKLLRIYLWW